MQDGDEVERIRYRWRGPTPFLAIIVMVGCAWAWLLPLRSVVLGDFGSLVLGLVLGAVAVCFATAYAIFWLWPNFVTFGAEGIHLPQREFSRALVHVPYDDIVVLRERHWPQRGRVLEIRTNGPGAMIRRDHLPWGTSLTDIRNRICSRVEIATGRKLD